MEDEATEDMEIMGGMTPSDKTYLRSSTFDLFKHRIPWLMLLMVSATFTGLIITHFESALAAQVAPGADAIRIVPGLDPDGLHRLAARLSEATTGLCAALTPTDKGTGYCLAQADGDVRALTKALNTALNGRGGGKPGICQGSCAATPEEAAEFLKNRE